MDELTQDIRQEEYNLLEKNEIDRFISQEEASLATQAHADKVNNLTDYEHKQVKKDNEDLIHTLITDIRNEIGMNEVQEKPSDILKNIGEEEAQRTPPDDEPKSKGPANTLPPDAPPHIHLPYTSFRYLSKFSDSSNPVLKAYGNGFKLGADLIGSTLEGAENFIKAFPKKYEALKNDFNGADVKDHLNELKEYIDFPLLLDLAHLTVSCNTLNLNFEEQALDLGFDPELHRLAPYDPTQGSLWDYVAHDFTLTRNRHGSGFWEPDRYKKPWGDKLTQLSETYQEIDLYLSDDNLLEAY